MTSLNRLIGLPVILKGRRIGQVEQGVLAKSGKSLQGVIVRNGFSGAKWLDINNIQTVGGVSVIAKTNPQKLPKEADFSLGPVWDTAGLRLGMVTDAYINEHTSQVTALEISSGPIDDLLHGRLMTREFVVREDERHEQAKVLAPCGSMETAANQVWKGE